jgi:hypothetical protein
VGNEQRGEKKGTKEGQLILTMAEMYARFSGSSRLTSLTQVQVMAAQVPAKDVR